MRIEEVEVRWLRMPMREPFETSFGREADKQFLLVLVRLDGVLGAGECVASAAPLYSSETNGTAWSVLSEHLIPEALRTEWTHPDDIRAALRKFRGNPMAKSALETAAWSAYAALAGQPLSKALGGERSEIEVGISVGIQPSVEALLQKIEGYLEEGYKRIKVKVKPGWDLNILEAIRGRFPEIPLMADANSAYTLEDLPLLKRFDEFGLTMVEQPLGHDDIVDHARLQSEIATPVCLDESIHSVADARKAVELGACRVVNIKIGRVGGLSEARDLSEFCRKKGVPVWCGGMLESGVGRLANVALTALQGFTLPGDTAPSARYFTDDIVNPPVSFVRPGVIPVPGVPGLGGDLDWPLVDRFTVRREWFSQGG